MGVGLEVYNANGTLQFDIGSRTFRVLTVQMVGSADGSVTVPELSSGTPIVGIVPSDDAKKTPTVSRSGNTVSWNYGGTPGGMRDSAAMINIAVF